MYNKVIMMGRLVADPELRQTPNGVPVCSYRIAVDRRFQTKGEDRKSDFFNVVSWRNDAEFVKNFFPKGRSILIEGELQTRQYTDKNGNQATWYEIVTDRVAFTGEPKSANSGGYSGNAGYPAPSAPAPMAATGNASDFVENQSSDDDYPF